METQKPINTLQFNSTVHSKLISLSNRYASLLTNVNGFAVKPAVAVSSLLERVLQLKITILEKVCQDKNIKISSTDVTEEHAAVA